MEVLESGGFLAFEWCIRKRFEEREGEAYLELVLAGLGLRRRVEEIDRENLQSSRKRQHSKRPFLSLAASNQRRRLNVMTFPAAMIGRRTIFDGCAQRSIEAIRSALIPVLVGLMAWSLRGARSWEF